MAGKLTARERGHALCERLKKHCAYARGDDHSPDCAAAAAAIQAHEDAVREECAALVDAEADVYCSTSVSGSGDDATTTTHVSTEAVALMGCARALRTRAATKDGQG